MSVFGEASIQVRTHIWIWWAEIALEPEAVALEQRATAVTLGAREEQFGVALTRESKASMIAIAACAHALDGVYGAVKEHVHVQAASRWATVLETLKAGFVVRDPQELAYGRVSSNGCSTFAMRPFTTKRRLHRRSVIRRERTSAART